MLRFVEWVGMAFAFFPVLVARVFFDEQMMFRRCAMVLGVSLYFLSVVAGNAWGVVQHNVMDLGSFGYRYGTLE